MSEDPKPKTKPLPWLRCPVCPSDNLSMGVEWQAQSLDPVDKDNKATVTEYHCDDCGRSFWL